MDQFFEEQLKRAIAYLITRFSPSVIYLLGSASRDELRPDSDIDIAFLDSGEMSAYECFDAAQVLFDYFHREVDLIYLNKASTVFKIQAIAEGKVIYCKDQERRMHFEMVAYKDYAKLNEERQEVFELIRERGQIYES